jgi:hypothetical protein
MLSLAHNPGYLSVENAKETLKGKGCLVDIAALERQPKAGSSIKPFAKTKVAKLESSPEKPKAATEKLLHSSRRKRPQGLVGILDLDQFWLLSRRAST